MKNLLFITLLCYCASSVAQPFVVEYFANGPIYYQELAKVNSIEVIDGNIWAGTFLGLMKINKSNPQEMECIIDPFVDYKPGYCFTLHIEKRSDNVLLVHMFYDLFNYSGSSFDHYPDSFAIYDIYTDTNSAIWILNDRTEIIRIDDSGITRISHDNSPLPDYDYEEICVENNVIWLGTHDNGLVRYENNAVTEFNYENGSLPDNTIISLEINNGVLWALCYEEHFTEGIATLMKYSEGNWTRYDNTNSPIPNTFMTHLNCIDDKLYVCCPGQLLRFDGIEWEIYSVPGKLVNCVTLDGNDIWIGTDKGFSLIRDTQLTNYNIQNKPFTGSFEGPVTEDLDGAIWVGTSSSYGNLCKKTGEQWTEVIDHDYINDNSYQSLAVDSNNVVWALTGDCLYRIDADSIYKFTEYNSVLVPWFQDIVVDKYNNKWINTSNQLVKYNDTVWTVYDRPDYDWRSGSSMAVDKKGNVWLTNGQKGMLKFNGIDWTAYDDAFFGQNHSQINTIIVDKEDNLWMDFEAFYIEPKLCKYNGESLEWFDSNINLPARGSGLKAIDKNGNIWYGSANGLTKYDWNEWTFYNADNTRLLNNAVRELYIDRKDNKWLASDCYLAKFNEDILYANPEIIPFEENSKFSVYPNPANTNNLNINVNERLFTNTQVTIIDMLGQIRYQKELAVNSDFTIDISSLSSGLYVMRFIQNGRAEIHKFLKL